MTPPRSTGTERSRVITDHEEIREWTENRGGHPARVSRTGDGGNGGDPGIIRIDFPGYSGEGSLEEISWEEFFDKFEEKQLALVVENQPPEGDKGRFNKLIRRSDG